MADAVSDQYDPPPQPYGYDDADQATGDGQDIGDDQNTGADQNIDADQDRGDGQNTGNQGTGDVAEEKLCTVCKYNNIQRKATDVCADCEEMYLCQECKYAHRQRSLFRYHRIIPICAKVSEDMTCDQHDARPIKSFCVQCEEGACAVCVEQLHDGHDVRNFFVHVQETYSEMYEAKKKSEMRANDLYALDGEMKDLKQAMTARMEHVTTAVEGRASAAVKDILQQRDDMVFRVQRTCDVQGMEQTMDEWVQVRERIAKGIQRGESISSGVMSNAKQVVDLMKATKELRILGNYKQVSSGPYREKLHNLPRFVPAYADTKIGKLVEPGSERFRREPKQISTAHESGTEVGYKDLTGNYDLPFPLQSQYRNIHSAVYLKPEGFAALAAQNDVGPASTLLLWVRDSFHVVSYGIHPAWDMDVDTQGVITVLCSARPYLRMVDPETRCRSGSIDIKGELSYPQSLAVNSHRGHYVILDGMGNHRLVVVDRNGTVLQYLKTGWDHWRIACDEKFMATCSSQEISIYEWVNNRLGKTRSFLHGELGLNTRDIACHGGDVYIAGTISNEDNTAAVYKILGKNLFQTVEVQALSFGDGELDVGDSWWLRLDVNQETLLLGCRAASTNVGRMAIFATNQPTADNQVEDGQNDQVSIDY